MIDPMVWMQGAVIHVANGDIAEAEAEFEEFDENGDCTSRLRIEVRSKVKSYGPVTRAADGTITIDEGDTDG